MATGYTTGYQHLLLDKEELTKRDFVKLCDEWFYHLQNYEMQSLEELELFRLKEIENYKKEIQKNKSRLTVLQTSSPDELKEEYETYVDNAIKANEHYAQEYKKERERLGLVREYAKSFSPHLDYIWKELKDPKLIQVDVFSYEEWHASQSNVAAHYIRFYSDLKEKAELRDDESNPAGQQVADYERRKRAFLAKE